MAEAPEGNVIENLPYPVSCGTVIHDGTQHFGMAWYTEGKKRIKITLLDYEDAQIVYAKLGKWLRGDLITTPD